MMLLCFSYLHLDEPNTHGHEKTREQNLQAHKKRKCPTGPCYRQGERPARPPFAC
jgi:hypothetical protein